MAFKQLKLWFDKDLAKMLATKITEVRSDFPSTDFVKSVDKGVKELELKPRVAFIAHQLRHFLGQNDQKNIKLLIKILGPENEEETGMFKQYYWIMPIAVFVEQFGLDHFDLSIKAIEEITKRNTGEYAIRPFIDKYPKQTLQQLALWSKNENKHVRRLCSEGSRPRLPWATKLQRFIDNPKPLFPILKTLRDDPSKYVQKSVANCLNDLLKDNPALTKDFLSKWIKGATPQRKWIIKHALRNLLKRDDAWAKEMVAS